MLMKRGSARHIEIFIIALGLFVMPSQAQADPSEAADEVNTTESVQVLMHPNEEDAQNGNNNFDSSNYTLGPEDVIEISVVKHPEFSGTYAINLDGKIQYSFVGDINIAGMTKRELEEKIKTTISAYVVSPEVNVKIVEFKSKVFYVLGEVGRPGKYNMRSESIMVSEAVMMAGLPTVAAAMRKARIITPDINGSTAKEVDLYSLFYGGDLKENVLLLSGDTLYVPAAVTESAGDMQDGNNNFDSSNYTLGPEDVIEINVVKHPDFSGTYPVDLEGKIQYKFVGDINVTGMTKGKLENKIKTIISAYVASPEVNVTIVEFKSKAFYVLGEVGSPGKYNMRSESITVSEAVMMAGLPTDAAAMRKARIITPGTNGSTTKEVDLYSLFYGGDLQENVLLHSGDTLYVPAAVTESAGDMQDGNNNFDSSNYTLGPEDVIEINVVKHPDFSGTYPVDLEGKIQYKFVGDINVTGMTKGKLENKIKTIISAYVASPEVNVTIVEFKSKAFYVLGEVGSPGKYNMRSESITVSEAVMMAGLPTDAAAMRKARIITPGTNGSTTKEVDLYSLLYGGDLKENVLLKPEDTLYVPASVTESAGDMQDGNNNFDSLKYTLGPEDVVEISVMRHPEFSGTYPISLEGKIQYKFVGDINVTGMTKGELENKIRTIISAHVASPEVNVMIVDFKSKAFYVLGEVGSPGKYNMRSESISVSEAVVMAGLPTEGAAMRKARIITPGINGSKIRKVNLYSLLYAGDLREDVALRPGDYLYVPSTVLAKLIRVISPVSTTVGLAAGPPATIGNSKAGISNLVK